MASASSTAVRAAVGDALAEVGVAPDPLPHSTVPAGWLLRGERRLDGAYYAPSVTQALQALHDSGLEQASVEGVTDRVWYPGRFKRVWAHASRGVPLAGGTEILHLRPQVEKFLSRTQTASLRDLTVGPGWILVTRSGSVGRAVLAGRRLAGFAVSEHVIRVIPEDGDVPAGYLLAYLSSHHGQALLKRSVFGAAVPEIEPSQVQSVPVPLLDAPIREGIDRLMRRAYELRDSAADKLAAANELVHAELRLPRFDDSVVPYLDAPPPLGDAPRQPHPRAFQVRSGEISRRLDASFHVPIAKAAVAAVGDAPYPTARLEEMAAEIDVPPRFPRNYVDREHGVPFLQGSHLWQMRPYDLKYLSRANTPNLQRWQIQPGWVLVTCSGTIGRVALSSAAQEGWAASQHILRIVPARDADAGYLAAFLATPYGQHQLKAKIYGGVVDELTEADTAAVVVPLPPPAVQERIGRPLTEAFEERDEANALEEQAVGLLESALDPGTRPRVAVAVDPEFRAALEPIVRQLAATPRERLAEVAEGRTPDPIAALGLARADAEHLVAAMKRRAESLAPRAPRDEPPGED